MTWRAQKMMGWQSRHNAAQNRKVMADPRDQSHPEVMADPRDNDTAEVATDPRNSAHPW